MCLAVSPEESGPLLLFSLLAALMISSGVTVLGGIVNA